MNKFKLIGIIVGAGILIALLLSYYKVTIFQRPIAIGFAAKLSGKQAELGVQERNGVQLAIEELNAAGGIAGRPITLIIRDDLGTPSGAKNVDRELIAAGVSAIIGHATSEETIAGLEVTEPAQIVLLGPTISSPDFTGKYKYFFRIHPSFTNSAEGFAKHIFSDRKLDKMAIIYDSDNAAYTKTYQNTFAQKYQSLGGSVVGTASFSAATTADFTPLIENLRKSNADGLLIIAADIDTALIAQHSRLLNWQVPLFSSGWAETASLIYNGGQAVSGMEIEEFYRLGSQSPKFLDFFKRYQDRFGKPPSFGASFGYESMMVLAAALQKNDGKKEGLRQALLATKNFHGLIDNFSFNQNGDVERPSYLNVIQDGKFVTRQKLNP
ncbi:MAG: ABC transporter substrate-binding protein [Pelosinus sp.]|nr:ABC transporter substrate-binding protein [Pelosinus sp.]